MMMGDLVRGHFKQIATALWKINRDESHPSELLWCLLAAWVKREKDGLPR